MNGMRPILQSMYKKYKDRLTAIGKLPSTVNIAGAADTANHKLLYQAIPSLKDEEPKNQATILQVFGIEIFDYVAKFPMPPEVYVADVIEEEIKALSRCIMEFFRSYIGVPPLPAELEAVKQSQL
jgi:hypothetical protein